MPDHALIAAVPDRFQLFWNEDYGSILVQIAGVLSPQDTVQFYSALVGVMDRSRARHGHALLLLDLSSNALMSDAVVNGFQNGHRQSGRIDDRIALVLPSSLVKLRMREVPADDVHPEYFISRSAAETWLHAHVRLLTH